MAGLRGLAAVRQLAESMKGGGAFARDFRLQDGESAEIWFNGTSDEPLIIHEHSVKMGKDFKTVTCSYPKPCVGCWAHENGDKRVGKRTAKAAFNVADTRWFHVKTIPGGGFNGKDKKEYKPCLGGPACKICRADPSGQKYPREMGGQKRWILSIMWAQGLDGSARSAGSRCRSCKIGKIKVLKYVNDMGKEVGIDDPNSLPEGVSEVLACSNKSCEDPKRLLIFDVPWTVTRTGTEKSTTYQFVPGAFQDTPDEVLDLEPMDLDKVCAPFGTGAQAKRIGIPDPFEGMAAKAGAKNLSGANIADKDGFDDEDEGEAAAGTETSAYDDSDF